MINELKLTVMLRVYKDGSVSMQGLQESERARLGDKLFEEINQAILELEEGYGNDFVS
jgi:hypothetical protein